MNCLFCAFNLYFCNKSVRTADKMSYSDILIFHIFPFPNYFLKVALSQLFPKSSTFPKESLSILTQTFFIRTIFFLFLLQDTRLDCLVE